jgi:hypothetical protein
VIRKLPIALASLAIVLSACRATGQSRAEAEYLEEKRAAVRALSRDSFPQINPAYDSLLKNLDRRLRAIIGPVNVPGFGPVVDLNLEGHYDGDPPLPMLDAVVFRPADYSRQLKVTTPTIMSAWLADHAPGISIDSALKLPELLTAAIVGEAVMTRYGDIPVLDAKRKGIASAMLILTAQDVGPWPPHEVLVSVVRRDLVFIIQAPTAIAIDTIPACYARWEAAFRVAPKPNDMAVGDTAFAKHSACYAEYVARIPGIEKIVSQVDSLVKLLPPR